jgi:hypothetical protein
MSYSNTSYDSQRCSLVHGIYFGIAYLLKPALSPASAGWDWLLIPNLGFRCASPRLYAVACSAGGLNLFTEL